MLGVQDQSKIQQLSFFVRKLLVGTNGAQDGLRRHVLGLYRVYVHTFVVIMAALDLIGVGHDHRHLRKKLYRLTQNIFNGGILWVGIIGIQGKYGTGKLVHDVDRGRFHDHVLNEILRQFSCVRQHSAEHIQLFLRRQIAKHQQPCGFLKTEAVFLFAVVHDVVDINATVCQFTVTGNTLTVADIIAIHGANVCQPCHNTRAVRIAQTTFYVISRKVLGLDSIMFDQLIAKKRDGIIGYRRNDT